MTEFTHVFCRIDPYQGSDTDTKSTRHKFKGRIDLSTSFFSYFIQSVMITQSALTMKGGDWSTLARINYRGVSGKDNFTCFSFVSAKDVTLCFVLF